MASCQRTTNGQPSREGQTQKAGGQTRGYTRDEKRQRGRTACVESTQVKNRTPEHHGEFRYAPSILTYKVRGLALCAQRSRAARRGRMLGDGSGRLTAVDSPILFRYSTGAYHLSNCGCFNKPDVAAFNYGISTEPHAQLQPRTSRSISLN